MRVYVVTEEYRGQSMGRQFWQRGEIVLGIFPATPEGQSKAQRVFDSSACSMVFLEEVELDLKDLILKLDEDLQDEILFTLYDAMKGKTKK